MARACVYTRRTVAGDRYQTDLWLVPYRGGRPRPLTNGALERLGRPRGRTGRRARSHSPAIAADATQAAALYLIRPDGGEAKRICAAPHGDVGAPVWSPDGRSDRVHRRGGPAAVLGRRPEATHGARDPHGRLAQRRRRARRTAATSSWSPRGRARGRVQVTTGDFDVAEPAWHPDGRRIAFAARMGPDADLDPKPRIHSVRAAAGRGRSELVGLRGPRPASRPGRRTAARSRSSAPTCPARPTTPSSSSTCGTAASARSLTGSARPAGHARLRIRSARLDGARVPAPIWDGDGAGRPDQPPRPRRGLARAARRRAGAAHRAATPPSPAIGGRGRRVIATATRRRLPARGVRGRGRRAAAADAPRRRMAAPPPRTRQCRGRRRGRARVPVRARPGGRTGARRSCSPRTVGPTAPTRPTPELDTWALVSLRLPRACCPTSAARAATAATGSRRSRVSGAAPTPTT